MIETSWQTWTLHRPEGAERMLVPRTKWGRIPATPLSDLVESDGYMLEQVERNSEYDLHADPAPLRAALTDATAFAGPDYRVLEWDMPTPPELRGRLRGRPRPAVDGCAERRHGLRRGELGTPIASPAGRRGS